MWIVGIACYIQCITGLGNENYMAVKPRKNIGLSISSYEKLEQEAYKFNRMKMSAFIDFLVEQHKKSQHDIRTKTRDGVEKPTEG